MSPNPPSDTPSETPSESSSETQPETPSETPSESSSEAPRETPPGAPRDDDAGPSGSEADASLPPETRVPDGETPAGRCRYCGRPFRTDRAHALHLGEEHGDSVSDGERTAYERAASDESDELFGFHMKVFVAIGVVYVIVVLAYMVAFGGGFG